MAGEYEEVICVGGSLCGSTVMIRKGTFDFEYRDRETEVYYRPDLTSDKIYLNKFYLAYFLDHDNTPPDHPWAKPR